MRRGATKQALLSAARPMAGLLLAAGSLVAVRLAAQTVTIAVDGIEREVAVIERQGHRFVPLETVARLLDGRVIESGPEQAVLEVDQTRLVVRRRLPYVEHEGRWYQMVEAAQKDAGGFYLPASSLEQLFPVLWPGRFPPGPTSGRNSAETLALGSASGSAPVAGRSGIPTGSTAVDEVPIAGAARGLPGGGLSGSAHPRVDVWAAPERTRLAFRLPRMPGITIDDGRPGILGLALTGTELPEGLAEGLEGVGLVDSATVRQAADGSALTLWLDESVVAYAVAPLREPAGLEVVLRSGAPDEATFLLASEMGPLGRASPAVPREVRRDEPALASMEGRGEIVTASDRPQPPPVLDAADPTAILTPAPPPRQGAPPDPTDVPPPAPRDASGPSRGSWKIVLDAGHGGRDPGSIGKDGTREKEVTLAVVRALSRRLEDEGVEIVLTRDGDKFVGLGDRTKLANRVGADLFVSIHANSADSRSAGGFETYFLSAAKTEDAKRVARMENAAIRYENPEMDPESLDELNFILWDLAQNEYLRESSALAETIQEELDRRLALESRGVKQAGFYVLNGAFMPAILFEMAFISNPWEEQLLNDREFRTQLVDGLADGLLDFLDQYGQKVVAQRAAR